MAPAVHKDLLVGTFNTPHIYTLRFTPPSALVVVVRNPAIGSHSWLALSPSKNNLYATAWLEPPSIVSYAIEHPSGSSATVHFLNQKPVKSRSGYTCASATHVYSAGGPSGEAFVLNESDGSIGPLVQELNFLEKGGTPGKTEDRPHGDFGGLRHGAHSADLSPNGKQLHVADIGRNCVWSFGVDNRVRDPGAATPHLTGQRKNVATRPTDGPRHATVHPSNRIVYSLQEHTSMVDAFSVGQDNATALNFAHGASILPPGKKTDDYWADEVRLSLIHHLGTQTPRYLWASTRGLHAHVKGYVAIYALDQEGWLEGGKDAKALYCWETPTSGGIANAVEPGLVSEGVEYAALTDSEEGYVFVISWDGREIKEVARVRLEEDELEGEVVKAATGVWL